MSLVIWLIMTFSPLNTVEKKDNAFHLIPREIKLKYTEIPKINLGHKTQNQ